MLAGPLTVALAGPAASAGITCGSVLTSGATAPTVYALSTNLTCPTGNAITVRGQDIVLDLKGRTLTGAGQGNGVLIDLDSSNVEVRNGTVRGFQYGVRIDTATLNRVWNLTLTGNQRGMDIANAGRNVLERNQITANRGDGIRFGGAGSRDNTARQNVISGNVWGVHVADGGIDNTVTQNQVSSSGNFGISVSGGSSGTTVSRNVVTDSGQEGILIVSNAGGGTVVGQNSVSGSAWDGIRVGTVDAPLPDAVVVQNTSTYNGFLGINAPGVTDGGGNVAYGNGNTLQCLGVVCSAG
ncbi:hypothetical protein GCM10009815_34600 [Nocardioides marmoribigeumensis]